MTFTQTSYDIEAELHRKSMKENFDLTQQERDWIMDQIIDDIKYKLSNMNDEELLYEANDRGIIT